VLCNTTVSLSCWRMYSSFWRTCSSFSLPHLDYLSFPDSSCRSIYVCCAIKHHKCVFNSYSNRVRFWNGNLINEVAWPGLVHCSGTHCHLNSFRFRAVTAALETKRPHIDRWLWNCMFTQGDLFYRSLTWADRKPSYLMPLDSLSPSVHTIGNQYTAVLLTTCCWWWFSTNKDVKEYTDLSIRFTLNWRSY
jgi:hypothetical protein